MPLTACEPEGDCLWRIQWLLTRYKVARRIAKGDTADMAWLGETRETIVPWIAAQIVLRHLPRRYGSMRGYIDTGQPEPISLITGDYSL